MKAALCIALSLCTFAHATAVAQVLSMHIGPGDKITIFSEVSTITPEAEKGICKKRYGKSFITKARPATIDSERVIKTSEGQKIQLLYQSGTIGNGVYSIENQYRFTFPDEGNGTSVKLQLAATGFIGSGRAAGVFTDGTCYGKVLIKLTGQHDKKTASQ